MKSFIKQNYFLILVIIVLIYSLIFPQLGLFVNEADLLSVMTFIAMFVSGLGLSINGIKSGLKDYKNIVYSFFAVYLFFPIITYIIFSIFNIKGGDIYVGGMILAAQSSTLSSAVVLTMTAGGNLPLALLITIVNNLASAFITPLILRVVLAVDKQIVFDIQSMIMKLFIVLILPIILAQLSRIFFEKYIKYINPWRKRISNIVVLSFILTGGAAASSKLKGNMVHVLAIIGLVIIIHIIMLFLGSIYSKIVKSDVQSKLSVMLCSSQKTLPASLFIWGEYFSQFAIAPIFIVSYHVMQLFIDSFYINLFNKKKNNMINNSDSKVNLAR